VRVNRFPIFINFLLCWSCFGSYKMLLHFWYYYVYRKSVKYGHRQGSNNDGVSSVTSRMTNGETTSPKLSNESCSSQNSSNRSSVTGDTSKLLGYQLIETSHENQDVVENSGSYTYRSKSCKISQVILHFIQLLYDKATYF